MIRHTPSPRSALLGAAVLLATARPAAAAVPTGFTDELVTNAVGSPTALAFTPDGRLLISSQAGQLYVYQNGSLVATPALDFTSPDPDAVCSDGERGLLGIAVHPAFATNQQVYLYYTHQGGDGCDNRVSRFTFQDADTIDPTSELVLLDNLDSPASNHNAGDLEFGRDGHLYVTIGDGGSTPARAQQLHWLNGKVVRVTDTGAIPADNPFQGAGTARCNTTGTTAAGVACREIFAFGFRNPFRFGIDPNASTTRFFVNDVGQGTWEEVDSLTTGGGNYGWSLCEGNHNNGTTLPCTNAPPGHVPPLFEYRHGVQIPGTSSPTNCNSITGGAFVPKGLWPGFDGSYLFGDVICGIIGRLTSNGSTWTASNFGSGLGGVVHLEFGPHAGGQALYYSSYPSSVRRIRSNTFVDADLDFHTLPPCRAVDTRGPDGPNLSPGQPRTFVLRGRCGVPAGARAVAVNLTVVGPNASGHLTVFATDEAGSFTSAVNFGVGQTRANNATLRLGAADGGIVTVPAGASAALVVDVVGYFE